jgi:folate-dependent phosphoribosylglycinamide formyltransferase PurN
MKTISSIDDAGVVFREEAIALFAYSFPHRKTHDFLLEIKLAGYINVIVFAAPWKRLRSTKSEKLFFGEIRTAKSLNTRDICRALDFQYCEVEHDDFYQISNLVKNNKITTGLVAGARILKKDIINLFENGIVNFHPGKLPETSGLDATFYSLKNRVPLGVTCHLIDHRVDAGYFLFFEELLLSLEDSIEIIIENNYQLQIIALRKFLKNLLMKKTVPSAIHRPQKNVPMMLDEKLKVLAEFSSWKSYIYFQQTKNKFFNAIKSGSLDEVINILNDIPSMIESRSNEGWTALIVASFHHRTEMVKLLISRGADPNETGKLGTTVLMYAKSKLVDQVEFDPTILDLLIKSGADLMRTDCFGKSIFDYVISSGNRALITYFKSRVC